MADKAQTVGQVKAEDKDEQGMTDEQIKAIGDLLMALVEYRTSEGHDPSKVFHRKVNRRHAADYYDIIKEPMWLNAIRDKINQYQYTSFGAFVRDIALVFHNARCYNRPESGAYVDAEELEKVFKEKLEKLVVSKTITADQAQLPYLGDIPDVEDRPPADESAAVAAAAVASSETPEPSTIKRSSSRPLTANKPTPTPTPSAAPGPAPQQAGQYQPQQQHDGSIPPLSYPQRQNPVAAPSTPSAPQPNSSQMRVSQQHYNYNQPSPSLAAFSSSSHPTRPPLSTSQSAASRYNANASIGAQYASPSIQAGRTSSSGMGVGNTQRYAPPSQTSQYTPQQYSNQNYGGTVAPHQQQQFQQLEVWRFSDETNLQIPEEVRKQFQCDERGNVLFFTQPPLDLIMPPAVKDDDGMPLRHSEKYLKAKIKKLRNTKGDEAAREYEDALKKATAVESVSENVNGRGGTTRKRRREEIDNTEGTVSKRTSRRTTTS